MKPSRRQVVWALLLLLLVAAATIGIVASGRRGDRGVGRSLGGVLCGLLGGAGTFFGLQGLLHRFV
ncbi:MAG TPA: hypothetical protein PLY56_07045, partial [Armatimonadota bacterium]|nr:hypothetical protein [Armatimonadota bacterium]